MSGAGLAGYPPGYMMSTATDPEETTMCSPAMCRSCGKVTWAGCGRHADQVMAGVPESRQCTCR